MSQTLDMTRLSLIQTGFPGDRSGEERRIVTAELPASSPPKLRAFAASRGHLAAKERFGLCTSELILRVKACDLKTAGPAVLTEELVDGVEELVVVLQDLQQMRDDQQSCFQQAWIGGVEPIDFGAEVFQQLVLGRHSDGGLNAQSRNSGR